MLSARQHFGDVGVGEIMLKCSFKNFDGEVLAVLMCLGKGQVATDGECGN
jgi:hypothetical protein